MPLVDPLSWSILLHDDVNSWRDFLGAHGLWHAQFDAHVRRVLQTEPYPSLSLGDGGKGPWTADEEDIYPPDSWHDAHQAVHDGAANALGLFAPLDFRAYDLRGAEEFATYTYLHALEHARLRQGAGL